jgi:tetratricopeptide (TPR) repeat protein
MVKKLRGGGPSKWSVNPRKLERLLELAAVQLSRGAYHEALATCERILRDTSRVSRARADALEVTGVAQSMLQNFEAAYAAYTEALGIAPRRSRLWYNRGLTCRYVMRAGQSVRDLERAVELEGSGKMARQYAGALDFSRELARRGMNLRGPGFTLEQLIEQEDLFQRAAGLIEAEGWVEAEHLLRQVIAMGDCLPQPWGNLGVCLMMQGRTEEAECALRRALQIDPEYETARHNLTGLEADGEASTRILRMQRPFEGRRLPMSLTFVDPDD